MNSPETPHPFHDFEPLQPSPRAQPFLKSGEKIYWEAKQQSGPTDSASLLLPLFLGGGFFFHAGWKSHRISLEILGSVLLAGATIFWNFASRIHSDGFKIITNQRIALYDPWAIIPIHTLHEISLRDFQSCQAIMLWNFKITSRSGQQYRTRISPLPSLSHPQKSISNKFSFFVEPTETKGFQRVIAALQSSQIQVEVPVEAAEADTKTGNKSK